MQFLDTLEPSRLESKRETVSCCVIASLITTRTTPTSTTHALNRLLFFQLRLWYAADAGGVEICLFGLDAAETAELDGEKGVSRATGEQCYR